MSTLLDSLLIPEQLHACRFSDVAPTQSEQVRGPSSTPDSAVRPQRLSEKLLLAYKRGWQAFHHGMEPADEAEALGWLDALRSQRDDSQWLCNQGSELPRMTTLMTPARCRPAAIHGPGWRWH